MGVAIGADLFMCAIEVITSKTKTIRVANEEEAKVTFRIQKLFFLVTLLNFTF